MSKPMVDQEVVLELCRARREVGIVMDWISVTDDFESGPYAAVATHIEDLERHLQRLDRLMLDRLPAPNGATTSVP